jgi:pimeloyl-ACP methyl ester carboxylesterase
MLILYIFLAYIIILDLFIVTNLIKGNPKRTLAKDQNKLRGTEISFEEKRETEDYRVLHVVEDGIERVTYTPKNRKYETPILMLHGMWHGAWCWENWQETLAKQGWETISFSQPGHAKSTLQRPIFLCTLDYYLSFIRDEIERLPKKPILMGHSMGGALTQWSLKYLGDNFPATVLVAPWVAKNPIKDGGRLFIKLDPMIFPLTMLQLNASSWVRSPELAAKLLITEGAIYSPEALHAKLGNESVLITFQHTPLAWRPPENVQTPMLILAGEKDAVVTVKGLQDSAEHYGAEFHLVPNSGHNLMMEATEAETIEKINHWLEEQAIS